VAVRRLGAGPTLVALHGFTLTGAQFGPLAGVLQREVVAPDLPGHGATRVTPITVDTAVASVAAVLRATGPAPLLGYSQGGRIALLVALAHPGLVTRLVLVSASAGIAEAVDRTARRRRDERLAARIEAEGLDAFLDRWLGTPPTATAHLPRAVRAADRRIRSENRPEGLAAALRGYGVAAQPHVGGRVRGLVPPLLAVAGARDATYVRHAETLARAAPRGELRVIPHAGHNVVLDAPRALARVLREFLTG